MERIILIVMEIIGYMWIGYFFGRWSWNTYQKRDVPIWLRFILWPWNVGFGARPCIDDRRTFLSIDDYAHVMMFFWGPKLVYNVVAFVAILVIYALFASILFILSLIIYLPRFYYNHKEGKKTKFFLFIQ